MFESGGLDCILTFIREHGSQVHKDTLHSSMTVVSRLCGKMEPQDGALETCIESLSTLLDHDDSFVSSPLRPAGVACAQLVQLLFSVVVVA